MSCRGLEVQPSHCSTVLDRRQPLKQLNTKSMDVALFQLAGTAVALRIFFWGGVGFHNC